jgi:transcriptional regulator with XRE-family HTH domain
MSETAAPVGSKSQADKEAEARVRAHVRQQMKERGILQAEVAKITRVDDGLLSRILAGDRGAGLGTVLKLCKGLKITPTRMLETDPPSEFWGPDDPGRPSDKKPH